MSRDQELMQSWIRTTPDLCHNFYFSMQIYIPKLELPPMIFFSTYVLFCKLYRLSSFGLIEQFRGAKPLKPKRTLRLQPSFFLPRSRLSVYFQKLIKGGFSVASRASPAGIKPVQRVAPSFVRNYSRLPLGGRPGKRKKSQNVILSC
jgi:hypothetical protein